MGTPNPRPAWQTILLAAHSLGRDEFTEADLTVAAWKADTKRLGLKGFEELYPDHKRIYCEVLKKLIQPKFLARVPGGMCRVRLTPAGRKDAEAILAGGGKPVMGRPQDWTARLKRIFESQAYFAWANNSRDPVEPSGVDIALAPCGGLARVETIHAELLRRMKAEEFAHPLYANVLSDLHDFLTAMWNRFGGEQ